MDFVIHQVKTRKAKDQEEKKNQQTNIKKDKQLSK